MPPSAGYWAAVRRIARPGSSAPVTGVSRVAFLVAVDAVVCASRSFAGRSWAGSRIASHDAIACSVDVETMPTAVMGSVSANPGMLFSYDLSYAKDSDGVYVSMASGTEPTGRVLGLLDPTLLENGIYHLRLMATDINGTVTSTTINVQVQGLAKIGLFTLTFTDLTIPVSGIPITVTRTYDSRVKVKRDFGVGWTLGVAAGSYERNRKPGDGWGFSALGNTFVNGIGTGCDVITETKKHAVTVRLSDREFYTFNLQFGTALPLSGGCGASVQFEQVDGISPGATLTVLGNNNVFAGGGSDQVLDDETGNVFDPQQVELVTPDGRTIDFDKTNGIFAVADLNGNSISISASGIVLLGARSLASLEGSRPVSWASSAVRTSKNAMRATRPYRRVRRRSLPERQARR